MSEHRPAGNAFARSAVALLAHCFVVTRGELTRVLVARSIVFTPRALLEALVIIAFVAFLTVLPTLVP